MLCMGYLQVSDLDDQEEDQSGSKEQKDDDFLYRQGGEASGSGLGPSVTEAAVSSMVICGGSW